MSDDHEADYIEQVRLTAKQRSFVDHYMSNGFDKLKAFHDAGYIGNSRTAALRIAKIFANPLVQAELAKRRQENSTQLRRCTPLEVMSANLDYWFNRAEDPTLSDTEQRLARAESQVVAMQAAPYVHPRLQAIAVRASFKERDIDEYSDSDLDDAIAKIEQKLQSVELGSEILQPVFSNDPRKAH